MEPRLESPALLSEEQAWSPPESARPAKTPAGGSASRSSLTDRETVSGIAPVDARDTSRPPRRWHTIFSFSWIERLICGYTDHTIHALARSAVREPRFEQGWGAARSFTCCAPT